MSLNYIVVDGEGVNVELKEERIDTDLYQFSMIIDIPFIDFKTKVPSFRKGLIHCRYYCLNRKPRPLEGKIFKVTGHVSIVKDRFFIQVNTLEYPYEKVKHIQKQPKVPPRKAR